MKSFAVRVVVGEFAGEGEGKSKKIAKKLAAAMVLEELRKLPHVPGVEKMLPHIKKKPKSIVKVTRRPHLGPSPMRHQSLIYDSRRLLGRCPSFDLRPLSPSTHGSCRPARSTARA